MSSKICTKCNNPKPLAEYSLRNKVTGRRHAFCKDCHTAYRHSHYILHKSKYLLKAKKWNKKQTSALRTFLFSYLKEHPCVDCGEDDLRVLDFDHVGKKFMGIAQMVRNCYSLAAILREIRCCKVRCANCHRIKTFSRGNYWKQKMGA